jgi:acyl-CoA synthetase (AMP-forming)/AMP-acid ligase II
MVVAGIAETLEEAVRPFGVHSHTVSLVDAGGEVRSVDYDELAKLASTAAATMQRAGVREGDRVAVALDSTLPSLAAQMGVWLAGATLLSIPPPPRGDDSLYRDGFRRVLRDCGCALLVGRGRVIEALAGAAPALAPAELLAEPQQLAREAAIPEQALVQFSSGTTGSPKGIVLSKDALVGHLASIREVFELDRDRDTTVSWLPLYHDMGFVGVWLTALVGRGNVTLMAPARFLLAPAEWLGRCAAQHATVTVAPDFGYRLAARLLGTHGLDGSLDSLRVCLFGAEPVSWATLETFAAAAEPFGLHWESLTPVYGMAEATLAVSCPPIGRGPRRDARGTVALGAPLPGLEAREVPLDGGGSTLALRGAGLLDGYLVGGELRDALDDGGWFATNDVGYVADGELHVTGRLDETVIVRGRNLFAEDVEAVAMSASDHEAVAVAAFRPHEQADHFALAVEVEPHVEGLEVARVLSASITRTLEAKVSPVVVLQPLSIPRTTSGKIRRAACRELLAGTGWDDAQVLARLG